jgi:DNA-directed RNA polymerase subunit RPC12/RpoP
MRVECPACGQRIEMTGRVVNCPNCGSPVQMRFETPLPTRPAPRDPLEELQEAREELQTPRPYVASEHPASRDPLHQSPPWLVASLIIGGVFLALFIGVYLVMVKLSSYATGPAPAPPPVVAPASAPPPPPPNPNGSKMFSFEPAQSAPAPAPTAPPPPVVAPAPATAPAPLPRFKVTPIVAAQADNVTDEAINAAISKGVTFLCKQFGDDYKLKHEGDQQAGAHALAALALLHAGQAISDERITIHSPFMIGVLEQLKKYSIAPASATYSHSLRAQALAVYNRTEDRTVLAADTRWLIAGSVKGAYGYAEPPKTATQPTEIGWDNSNSQYGALGVWAASDAGIPVPSVYWTDVQSHWEQSQTKSGGWNYHAGGNEGTLSMTAAGVNMLFVANEMLSALRPDVQISRPPFSPSLQLGLDWLAQGTNAVDIGAGYPFYTLYGMERAGLACGFKMFGEHDWYRELALQTIKRQDPSGSWGSDIDTSFALLFLSRGRHPLMMNKLHFIGAWANRPRDVAHLAKFTSKEVEHPLNWQVVSLKNDWGDWMDSPILYLASHEAPIFDDSDYDKLRAYVMAGGLLFTQADGGNKEFNQWAELLAIKLFNQELKDLPANHFINNALFRPKETFPLKAVSNGTRVLMLHCSDDIAKRWQAKSPKDDRPAFELGANLFVYATGRDVPRNRIDSLFVPDIPGAASVTVPIARLKHAGDWDPEPYAWVRESRMFRDETSIGLAPTPVDIEKLSTDIAPIAHFTSSTAITLSDARIAALQKYVNTGGVLLIDACGGAPQTRQSVRDVVTKMFPDKPPTEIRTDHPLLAGKGDGLTQIAKPQVRSYVYGAIGQKYPKLQIVESGKGAILLSEMDLTSGLLGNKTLGIVGYDPLYAHAFVRNAILWTLNGRGDVTPWQVPTDSSTPPATQPTAGAPSAPPQTAAQPAAQ